MRINSLKHSAYCIYLLILLYIGHIRSTHHSFKMNSLIYISAILCAVFFLQVWKKLCNYPKLLETNNLHSSQTNGQNRKGRFTMYFIADQSCCPGTGTALKTCKGQTLASVSRQYAEKIRLEGTGTLNDGRWVMVFHMIWFSRFLAKQKPIKNFWRLPFFDLVGSAQLKRTEPDLKQILKNWEAEYAGFNNTVKHCSLFILFLKY